MDERTKRIALVAGCVVAIAGGGWLVFRSMGSKSARAESALESMLTGSDTDELLHRRAIMAREIADAETRNPDSELLAGARRGLADIDAELERRGVDPASASEELAGARPER